MGRIAVRPMRPGDRIVACIVSADAAERFREVDEPRIAACADDPPFTPDELDPYVAAGRGWVATEDGAVVGFVVVDLVDGGPHIEEIDVAPAAGRQGHGGRLLDEVAHWASTTGFKALTLTTFRDVPWNAPWYERHGFEVVPEPDITPELRRRRDDEDAHGLPAELRVVMRRDLGT